MGLVRNASTHSGRGLRLGLCAALADCYTGPRAPVVERSAATVSARRLPSDTGRGCVVIGVLVLESLQRNASAVKQRFTRDLMAGFAFGESGLGD